MDSKSNFIPLMPMNFITYTMGEIRGAMTHFGGELHLPPNHAWGKMTSSTLPFTVRGGVTLLDSSYREVYIRWEYPSIREPGAPSLADRGYEMTTAMQAASEAYGQSDARLVEKVDETLYRWLYNGCDIGDCKTPRVIVAPAVLPPLLPVEEGKKGHIVDGTASVLQEEKMVATSTRFAMLSESDRKLFNALMDLSDQLAKEGPFGASLSPYILADSSLSAFSFPPSMPAPAPAPAIPSASDPNLSASLQAPKITRSKTLSVPREYAERWVGSSFDRRSWGMGPKDLHSDAAVPIQRHVSLQQSASGDMDGKYPELAYAGTVVPITPTPSLQGSCAELYSEQLADFAAIDHAGIAVT